MKYFYSILAILFVFSTVALANEESPSDNPWVMNFNGLLGFRALDKEDWSPKDKQIAGGIEFDFRKKQWPVSFLVGVLSSNHDNSNSYYGRRRYNDDSYLTEGYLGIRKYFDINGSFFPYISLGGSYIGASVCDCNHYKNEEQSDSSFGYFGSIGGIFKQPLEIGSMNLGFDIRGLGGTSMNLLNKDVQADYVQLSFVMGFGW
ncbi:hypothetical protein MNBD_NITROSPINAE02-1547 [hydrothermal vent metagenome]|uniref:Outer membrane protein beta-barrel domain-containing protein n=1 Tax=hydrothermal vent metagenome TaxID=652676 RepID=A0A3B1C066_9ZZZZ